MHHETAGLLLVLSACSSDSMVGTTAAPKALTLPKLAE